MNNTEKKTNGNEISYETVSSLILHNDVSKMTPKQKVECVVNLCKSLDLNPMTKPFQLISFKGKETIYATKDCTEQLRKIHGVSVKSLEKLLQNDLYIVTATVEDRNGRQDASSGAVCIKGLKGDDLANAIMKAETKAKRRATLSICGLGILDESETDTIGEYSKIDINTETASETQSLQKQPETQVQPNVPKHVMETMVKEAGKSKTLAESFVDQINFAASIDELTSISSKISVNVDSIRESELAEIRECYREKREGLLKFQKVVDGATC